MKKRWRISVYVKKRWRITIYEEEVEDNNM